MCISFVYCFVLGLLSLRKRVSLVLINVDISRDCSRTNKFATNSLFHLQITRVSNVLRMKGGIYSKVSVVLQSLEVAMLIRTKETHILRG